MMLSKILVAYDDSDLSKKALATATDMAVLDPDSQVDVVYVAPIPYLTDSQSANLQAITDMIVEDGKQILQNAYDSLDKAEDKVTTLLLTSVSPASELLKLIEADDYDLVIIGNRGLSGIKEYMGSVSHKVLHGSTIPVLVIK